MIEKRIIKACIEDREHYEQIDPYIVDLDFQDYGKHVYNEIADYYRTDAGATSVDTGFLLERVITKYPKKSEAFTSYIGGLPENISGLNVLRELNDLRRELLGEEIAGTLLQKKDATSLMEKYLTQTNLVAPINGQVMEAPSLDLLLEAVKPENLVPIYPSALNDAIGGGVPRQSQICVFARPDVGKTTCAVNIAGGALLNGYKVLYIGNEDPSEVIVLRIISRLVGLSRREIMASPKEHEKTARERGYNNFTFAGLTPGTIPEIRSLIEATSPDVMVIDQVKNLQVSKEQGVENLELAVKHTRSLAKEFNLVSIVVTQAGESARNKLILGLEDVYNSKTGIPGQMDLMIGIGQDITYRDNSRVMLSMPKNKLSAPVQPLTCKIDYVTNTIYGPK